MQEHTLSNNIHKTQRTLQGREKQTGQPQVPRGVVGNGGIRRPLPASESANQGFHTSSLCLKSDHDSPGIKGPGRTFSVSQLQTSICPSTSLGFVHGRVLTEEGKGWMDERVSWGASLSISCVPGKHRVLSCRVFSLGFHTTEMDASGGIFPPASLWQHLSFCQRLTFR